MRRGAGSLLAVVGAWWLSHARSAAVRHWRPPTLERRRHGGLAYRVGGPPDAPIGVILLHGLVATGDVFGATPEHLARGHRVIVPDLLGFGRSLDEERDDFSTAAHLDALDEIIDRELDGKRLHLGAHSMGSALALRWAARNTAMVDRVVCLGAPAWPDPAAARRSLGRLGPMSRALLVDDRAARAMCEFSCQHRALAGMVSAAVAPRWPIPIARQASLHTWPAYIQALEEQIIDCPWDDLLMAVVDGGVEVRFVHGNRDSIGDISFLRSLAATHGFDLAFVDGDHTLPAADPDLLSELLT